MRKNKWGTCAAGDAVLLIQIILGGSMCIVQYNETSKNKPVKTQMFRSSQF